MCDLKVSRGAVAGLPSPITENVLKFLVTPGRFLLSYKLYSPISHVGSAINMSLVASGIIREHVGRCRGGLHRFGFLSYKNTVTLDKI